VVRVSIRPSLGIEDLDYDLGQFLAVRGNSTAS
jgi:hypothetical protein